MPSGSSLLSGSSLPSRRTALSPLTGTGAAFAPGATAAHAGTAAPARSAATAHPPGARVAVPANRPQLGAAEVRAPTPARRPGAGNPHLPSTWEMRVVDGGRGLSGQPA